MRGGDAIIKALMDKGVDTIFGYPGGAVLNIYDALYKYSDKIEKYDLSELKRRFDNEEVLSSNKNAVIKVETVIK